MYHGLCCAFAVLTDDGSTALSLERHWQPLLLRLRPELTPQQVVLVVLFFKNISMAIYGHTCISMKADCVLYFSSSFSAPMVLIYIFTVPFVVS
jgi:hypothetical protein